MIDCLYRRLPSDGDLQVFESTDGTRSNWDAEIQHGSPPLALLTKAIEDAAAPALRIGRLSLDILGAIPVAPMAVRTWTPRPGNRIAMMSAEMTPVGAQRPVARVTAWLLAPSDTRDAASDRHPPLTEGEPVAHAHAWMGMRGYLDTVSWRTQAAEPGEPGVVWVSPLLPVVGAEPATPVQRLAMVVDSANGAGAVLDPTEYLFMNVDTTVHLHRVPSGNDFALRARASIGPDGVGVTSAEVFDSQGYVATVAQTLLVRRR